MPFILLLDFGEGIEVEPSLLIIRSTSARGSQCQYFSKLYRVVEPFQITLLLTKILHRQFIAGQLIRG